MSMGWRRVREHEEEGPWTEDEWHDDQAGQATAGSEQPEPEAAMHGLWIGSLEAAQREAWTEAEDELEIYALEKLAAERLTFGVDSGAALTVVGRGVASDYPKVGGPKR